MLENYPNEALFHKTMQSIDLKTFSCSCAKIVGEINCRDRENRILKGNRYRGKRANDFLIIWSGSHDHPEGGKRKKERNPNHETDP